MPACSTALAGARAPAAKRLAAGVAWQGPCLGVGGEAVPGVEGSGLTFTLCGAVSFSGLEGAGAGHGGPGGPALPPSLTAGMTLDKQLESTYLRPYGVGEQVCR